MPDLDTLLFNTTAVKPPTHPRNETERRAKAQQAKTDKEEAAAVAKLAQSRRVRRRYPIIDSADATPEHPAVNEGDSSPLFVRSTSATPTRNMTPEHDVTIPAMDHTVMNERAEGAVKDTASEDANMEPAQSFTGVGVEDTNVIYTISEDLENTSAALGDRVGTEFNAATNENEGDKTATMTGDETDVQSPEIEYDLTLRHHYQDKNGVDHEIWRPGDPDGDPKSGFHGDPNAGAIPWRLFQHSIGKIVKHENEPPKYVLLDDLAVYEVLQSQAFSKKDLSLFWHHDFGNMGYVRANRAHVGRAAIVSEGEGEVVATEDGQGPGRVGWGKCGQSVKSEKKYFFTGEKDGYDPILYPPVGTATPTTDFRKRVMDVITTTEQSPGPQPALKKARRGRPPTSPIVNAEGNPAAKKLRAHQIYTNPNPTHRHSKPKINTYLRATPSPPWPGPFRSAKVDGKRRASVAFGEEGGSQAAYVPQPETATPIQNMGVADTVYEKVRGLEEELAAVKWELRQRDEEIARLNEELQLLREQGQGELEEGEHFDGDV
ncbi:hypothetical protein H2203_000591 [Taxawa tesnikishii (nom. ined.)]|nr:hypothetical protein H2203_000591 [Dothideales sp. JES 119]